MYPVLRTVIYDVPCILMDIKLNFATQANKGHKGNSAQIVMSDCSAVFLALKNEIPNLCGICVIDVVEGTAMDALSSMQSFLRGRPKTFPSLAYAVEWSVRSGQVKNVDSARVSMPGQLKSTDTGRCAIHHVKAESTSDPSQTQPVEVSQSHKTISEDDEREVAGSSPNEQSQEFKVQNIQKDIGLLYDVFCMFPPSPSISYCRSHQPQIKIQTAP